MSDYVLLLSDEHLGDLVIGADRASLERFLRGRSELLSARRLEIKRRREWRGPEPRLFLCSCGGPLVGCDVCGGVGVRR